ncbi:Rab-3A-interacting protein [Choanephora cucurbitarum]|uniref:Rab-3A-interacting protein n=1 Tax=Choanephora cucurbitarum TaxID=101091 RepID=A0A1C7NGB3_9FUNG|nr:Rab-3A-interacting protein [Choanephora cucurbitarum]
MDTDILVDAVVRDHLPEPEQPLETEYEETASLFEKEFTEQDFLPFLLQAQDMIAKLESRVVELENDLSTIHRKYEHDRREWLVGLSQKDQYITHLTGKLQKAEFNSKEAIVLLSDFIANNNMMEENMKSTAILCLNYLRQTEIPQTQTKPMIDSEDEGLEEGELERRQAAVAEWRRTDIPDNSSTACDNEDPTNSIDGLSSLSSSSTTSSAHVRKSFVLSDSSMTLPTTYAVHDEDTSFCSNCKQLLTQLDAQVERQAYLKRDLSALASALSEEEDIRSSLEQDKEALEEDVADITSALFTSLNQIFMDEVTDRDGLVQTNRETNGKLDRVLDAWDLRDSRLKQLKDLLIELDSAVHTSANASGAISRRYSQQQHTSATISRFTARSSTSSGSHPLRFSVDQQSQYRCDNNTIRIDGFVLSEFQQHMKAVIESKTLSIPATPFVKRVMTEDVEPCLFFQQSQGWWKSPWFKKKLMDAITQNKCEIQGWHDPQMYSNYTSSSISTSPSTSHLSVSSQQSNGGPMPPKTKCACCNILRVCEFKMRLPIPNTGRPQQKQQQQPWLPIDRFCRDRLVAVCGYFSFMSHLKLLTSSPILSIFKQVMHHRRKMTLARVGSIGLFEEEDEETDTANRRLSSSSNSSSKRRSYQQQRHSRRNRESIVLDHSGSGSDTASVVSVSELQGLEGTQAQIVIVH